MLSVTLLHWKELNFVLTALSTHGLNTLTVASNSVIRIAHNKLPFGYKTETMLIHRSPFEFGGLGLFHFQYLTPPHL